MATSISGLCALARQHWKLSLLGLLVTGICAWEWGVVAPKKAASPKEMLLIEGSFPFQDRSLELNLVYETKNSWCANHYWLFRWEFTPREPTPQRFLKPLILTRSSQEFFTTVFLDDIAPGFCGWHATTYVEPVVDGRTQVWVNLGHGPDVTRQCYLTKSWIPDVMTKQPVECLMSEPEEAKATAGHKGAIPPKFNLKFNVEKDGK